MADAKNVGMGPVEQPRQQDYQPYDATTDADVGAWAKISADVPGGSEDLWRTEFPDSPPWRQV
jgi:hypothetical protein